MLVELLAESGNEALLDLMGLNFHTSIQRVVVEVATSIKEIGVPWVPRPTLVTDTLHHVLIVELLVPRSRPIENRNVVQVQV